MTTAAWDSLKLSHMAKNTGEDFYSHTACTKCTG